jgi:hypothetical protein
MWLDIIKVVVAIAAIIMALNSIYGATKATRGAIDTWTAPREARK